MHYWGVFVREVYDNMYILGYIRARHRAMDSENLNDSMK